MGKPKTITRKQFILGSGALAAAVGGYGAYRLLRRRGEVTAEPEIYLPAIDLVGLDPVREFDVCIIGSGPAGTSLGIDLAEQGLSTLIVESGLSSAATGRDSRFQALDLFENTGSIEYPVAASRIRALGGTSNIWTGRCSRLHPIDFEQNAYTPPGAAWPVDYSTLMPFYLRAERTLRVLGGELSNFHAPRAEPLPVPPYRDIDGLKQLFDGIGVTLDDSPTSKSADAVGPVRAARDLLPKFTSYPNAVLLHGATIRKLNAAADGSIIEAYAEDLNNEQRKIKARIYVVAAGALASARLLLMSHSKHAPTGIGNEHDQVGRFFNEHPNLTFSGEIRKSVKGLDTRPTLGRCHQFYDSLKAEGLGSAILVANHGSRKNERETPVKFRIGATLEMLPTSNNRITLSRENRDYFGDPAAAVNLNYSEKDDQSFHRVRGIISDIFQSLEAKNVSETEVTWSHHHIGGCCMGDDPRHSVVDANLKVHETENLYVLSSGNFVTGGASHPTLGIVAFAHRLAEHLRVKLTSMRQTAA